MVAMCVLMFAITHPEILVDSPPTIEQISVNVVKNPTAPPELPTPLPRRRLSKENYMDDEMKVPKTFYTKSDVMFFTHKRIQSGKLFKTYP